ncbi:hypothetical protein GGX14DRAFT_514350 [Mycena pura]|uniref:FAD/NAD(P)-binding domain-containing protein n=1 Tax=Mycena pura TaxID=153505 RepID=A0AAD6VSB3_9AGAR|nr:hypothetical protein GGX14DRAFT_514350 [Mycena pura]
MPDVVIIGAGIGGLACAIGLKRQLGLKDFTVYERASDVGGTWRGNIYPGAASDTYVHFYSLSTDLNPNWDTVQGTQPEIQNYWRGLSKKYDLYRHISFDTLVVSAEWNEKEQKYYIVTRDAEGIESITTAKILISAIGILDIPHLPNISGASSFKGEMFHSAQWNAAVDLRNKRVAVIGNGCSATQLVPAITQDPTVQVTQFCRTPSFFLPEAQAPYNAAWKWAFRYIPFALWLHRIRWYLWLEGSYLTIFRNQSSFTRKFITEYILKPWLTSRAPKEDLPNLIPNYDLGCKRLIFDTNYLPALHRPNVNLNWEGIQSISEDGIVTKQGKKMPFDIIVWATGFVADRYPLSVRGTEGKTLQEYYDTQGCPKAYKGTSVPSFPNFFLIAGPNTLTGHQSVLLFEEIQVNYILKFVKPILANIVSSFVVKPEATDRYDEWVHSRLSRSVYMSCLSWYRKGGDGKISTIFPGSGFLFWWCLRRPTWSDYKITGAGTHWSRWVRQEALGRWFVRAVYAGLAVVLWFALTSTR